jgi:hypothetical protein
MLSALNSPFEGSGRRASESPFRVMEIRKMGPNIRLTRSGHSR